MLRGFLLHFSFCGLASRHPQVGRRKTTRKFVGYGQLRLASRHPQVGRRKTTSKFVGYGQLRLGDSTRWRLFHLTQFRTPVFQPTLVFSVMMMFCSVTHASVCAWAFLCDAVMHGHDCRPPRKEPVNSHTCHQRLHSVVTLHSSVAWLNMRFLD